MGKRKLQHSIIMTHKILYIIVAAVNLINSFKIANRAPDFLENLTRTMPQTINKRVKETNKLSQQKFCNIYRIKTWTSSKETRHFRVKSRLITKTYFSTVLNKMKMPAPLSWIRVLIAKIMRNYYLEKIILESARKNKTSASIVNQKIQADNSKEINSLKIPRFEKASA